MMQRRVALAGAVLVAAILVAPATRAAQQAPRPTFRGNLTVVSVDVVVRDKDGNVVRGLTDEDFEIREDGRSQDVQTFSFQEITTGARPAQPTALLAGVEARVAEQALLPAAAAAAGTQFEPVPMRSEDLAGRRLIVLLFDTSSMQPEDVQRSAESAQKYVAEQMSESDLIAVATVSSMLNVITDFTGDRAQVEAALNTLSWTEGTATPPVDASTAATDEAAAAATEGTSDEAAEFDMFNNDVRLRVLETLAEALTPIEQKKAIVYFSAGMQRSGSDNQVELRAAINAAIRGNVSIYAIDTRGLQAVVPGGDATQASGRGRACSRAAAWRVSSRGSPRRKARSRRSRWTRAVTRSPTRTISARPSPGSRATCRPTICWDTSARTPPGTDGSAASRCG